MRPENPRGRYSGTGRNGRGGSEETHERMVGTAIRFTEKVKDRGKTLGELETREFRDLLEESMEE